MDPNANLAEQEAILLAHYNDPLMDRHERERLLDLRDALDTWLFNGGAAPDWSRCPRAAAHYTHRRKD
jgi:hypothetical protein